MAGRNTTGLPNTQHYELGRGRLFIGDLDANDVPTAWRDVGNAPKFSYKVSASELDHMSSRTGVKDIDASVPLERKVTGSFELDEMSFQNIALTLMGDDYTAQTNAAVAGFTVYTNGLTSSVVMGRWYDIKNSSGVRAYNVAAGDVVIKKTPAGTTLVKDTDYLLDSDMGRVFILTTGVVVVAGDGIDITLTANGAAKTLDVVKALNQSAITKAIKFLSLNPVTNDVEAEYQFHKCSIRPAADVGLIDDKFLTLGLEFTAFKTSWAAAVTAGSQTLTIVTHALADNNP